MQIKLSDDGAITFIDGNNLNRNTLNRKWLIVTPETALATRESLWVQFGDSQNFEDVNANILEPVRLSEEAEGYKTIFPAEVVQKAGTWYMTLAIRVYSTDGTTFSEQLTSEKVSFTVNDSFPMDDGGFISNGTLENVWQDIQESVENAAGSASAAANSASQAAQSVEEAETAQAAAEAAEAGAEAAQSAAEAAQAAAETAQGKAETAQSAAETAQGKAETAQAAAETAQTAAETAEGNAKTSETNAASSASAAAQSAVEAQAYMEQAKQYAQKEYQIYDSFEELPNPGDSAYIYLVPTSGGSGNDSYSEYLWITETGKYEFIGNVNDVDLSGYAQVNGTYPNMTVGNATNAVNATNATNAENATSAASATKATQDGAGNVIADTYATKTEVTEGLAGKQPTGNYALQNGTYPDMTVGNASNADHATSADSATNAANAAEAEHAEAADSATNAANAENAANVTGTIGGKAISDIFEADGTTAKEATHAASADSATQAARATVANSATTAQLGQSGVPSASDDDKIVTTEYLYPGSAEGNGVSSFSFVYRGVTHSINITTSFVNTASNWMRVVRSGNTVTVGWTLAIKTTLSKGTNYTIASGLPNAAHTENNCCVGIAPDGTVFTVYVNTSGQIILRPQTGNLTSQTVYLGCTYLTNEA